MLSLDVNHNVQHGRNSCVFWVDETETFGGNMSRPASDVQGNYHEMMHTSPRILNI